MRDKGGFVINHRHEEKSDFGRLCRLFLDSTRLLVVDQITEVVRGIHSGHTKGQYTIGIL